MDQKVNQKMLMVLKVILTFLLLVIILFPGLDYEFGTGIDSSLQWVFNYFAETGFKQAQNIIFPHGPLAFITYPIYFNIITGTLIRGILQLSIIFVLYTLIEYHNRKDWITPSIASFIILLFADINLLIISNICCYYLISLSIKEFYKHFAFFLAALSFYVKAYTGILAASLTFSFVILEYFEKRNFFKLILNLSEVLSLLILIWVVIFRSFSGISDYFIGLLNHVWDNSAAVSLYPDNDWLMLSGFVLSLFTIPFLDRNKKTLQFLLLVTFSLFAAWKHAMSREDYSHAIGLYRFIIICIPILLSYRYLKSIKVLIALLISLFFYHSNLENTINFLPSEKKIIGINNFFQLIGNFSKAKYRAEQNSFQNIKGNRLPDNLKELIGYKEVDIYPWDYSIIPANSLNWKPRIVLQSYASYTPWLDRQNSEHFNSKNAPEFIIWHYNMIDEGRNPCYFESIDQRYILNDEPETIVSLISNYSELVKADSFIIFKKRSKPIIIIRETDNNPIYSSWGEWIEVPENSGIFLRAKLSMKKNFPGVLKSLFYKDEEFRIFLKTSSGKIFFFRIVPDNAETGVWINPLYLFQPDHLSPEEVSQVKFDCFSRKFVKKAISVQWEYVKMSEEMKLDHEEGKILFNSLYSGVRNINQPFLLKMGNTYDSINEMQKSSILNRNDYYSFPASHLVKAGSYSEGITLDLDKMDTSEVEISLYGYFKASIKSGAALVLSIEGKNGLNYWGSTSLSDLIFEEGGWNFASIYKRYRLKIEEGNILKAYFWNPGSTEILIDNMMVEIVSRKR